MKSIARAFLVVTLASAAVAATAATPQWPSGGIENYNQASVFPTMQTYESQHHDSALGQAFTGYPSAAQQEYPLSGEFPAMQTYLDLHANAPVTQATAPTFPYSVEAEPSMADEGLVPGIVGIAPYAAQPGENAVGATR